MSLIRIVRTLLLLGLLLVGSPLRGEPVNIYFKTSPRFEQLRPFADPADLSILVTRSDGRPLDRGTARLRLDAPRSGLIFSTDFPIIEGTRLLDLSVPIKAGRAQWKYLFPIRGEYLLAVDILRDGATIGTQNFEFKVRENERKWFFLSLFLFLLFALGWVAGRIFSGPKSTLTKGVFLFAGLLATLYIASAQSKGDRSEGSVIEVSPGAVGKLSHVRWRLAEPTASEVSAVALTLFITHLEKEKTMFAVERLPVLREFSMDYQFPDGAEYRVTAVAEVRGRAPIRSERRVAVTGVEPPAQAMLPTLGLFVGVIAVGLAVGRWTKLRKSATSLVFWS